MEIYDVNGVAEYLKVSTSSIRKLVREEKIPFFRILKKICFEKTEIDKWVKKQYKIERNNQKYEE